MELFAKEAITYERPQRRDAALMIKEDDPETVSNEDLLAAVLTPVKARVLLDVFQNDVRAICRASFPQLMRVRGIDRKDAAKLKALYELAKRTNMQSCRGKIFQCPQDIAEYFMGLSLACVEQFYVVCLNTRMCVVCWKKISSGTLNAAIIHPRDVFRWAIEQNAATIVLIHNHPSGDSSPSEEDIALTKRLVEAGKLIGIDVLDHLVIGGGQHCSFKKVGLL